MKSKAARLLERMSSAKQKVTEQMSPAEKKVVNDVNGAEEVTDSEQKRMEKPKCCSESASVTEDDMYALGYFNNVWKEFFEGLSPESSKNPSFKRKCERVLRTEKRMNEILTGYLNS